jgi:type I restriction enzyme S subunit
LARRNDSSKRKIDGREIQIGDVLVNSTGVGTLGRLAPVRFLPEPSVTDSHVTVVRANTRLISKAFLAGLMLSSEPFIEASGAGSTGQTELRKQVLEDIMFAMPSLELSATYETIVSPMGQQIACLEEQLTSLARTRDSLLPKLLSGELSVSETESGPTGSEETANV